MNFRKKPMDNNKRKKFVLALIMVTVLVAAENANSENLENLG